MRFSNEPFNPVFVGEDDIIELGVDASGVKPAIEGVKTQLSLYNKVVAETARVAKQANEQQGKLLRSLGGGSGSVSGAAAELNAAKKAGVEQKALATRTRAEKKAARRKAQSERSKASRARFDAARKQAALDKQIVSEGIALEEQLIKRTTNLRRQSSRTKKRLSKEEAAQERQRQNDSIRIEENREKSVNNVRKRASRTKKRLSAEEAARERQRQNDSIRIEEAREKSVNKLRKQAAKSRKRFNKEAAADEAKAAADLARRQKDLRAKVAASQKRSQANRRKAEAKAAKDLASQQKTLRAKVAASQKRSRANRRKEETKAAQDLARRRKALQAKVVASQKRSRAQRVKAEEEAAKRQIALFRRIAQRRRRQDRRRVQQEAKTQADLAKLRKEGNRKRKRLAAQAAGQERREAAASRQRRRGGVGLGVGLVTNLGRGAAAGGLGGIGSGIGTVASSALAAGGAAGLVGGLGAAGAAAGLLAAATAVTAFTAAVAAGIPDSIQFNRQLAELRSISQGNQLSFTRWSTEVTNLSNQLGIARQEIAEGAYQTLSNQVASGAEAFKFLRVAQLSVVQPTTSVADAVNAVSSVLNSYNKDISETDRVTAIWFKTMELGRFRLNEVANRIGRLTFSANALGISFEESAASLSLLTRKGIPANEASTLLINVINQLIKASPALQDVFRKWGVGSGQAAIATFGWAGTVEKLSQEVAGSSQELSALFPELRAFRGLTGLAANGAEELGEEIEKLTGAQEDFNKALKDTTGSAGFRAQAAFNELKNTMAGLSDIALAAGVVLGRDLADSLGLGTQAIKTFTNQTKFALEILNTIQNVRDAANIAPAISDPIAEGLNEFKESIAARAQLTNKFAAFVRKNINELQDANAGKLLEDKEFFKASLEVRNAALSKERGLLDKQATQLRKSVKTTKTLTDEMRSLVEDQFQGAQRTSDQIRGILSDTLGEDVTRNILGREDQLAIQRLQQLQQDARQSAKVNDVGALRTATNASVQILKAQQARIASELGKFKKSDLNSPDKKDEFLSRTAGLQDIQRIINNLKREEFQIELRISKENRERAEKVVALAERNRIVIKDIASEQKRLFKLDPSTFKTIEEGAQAFDSLADGILGRTEAVSPAEAQNMARLVAAMRESFSIELQREVGLKNLTRALTDMGEASKKVQSDLTENLAVPLLIQFAKIEEQALRTADAIAKIQPGLGIEAAKDQLRELRDVQGKKGVGGLSRALFPEVKATSNPFSPLPASGDVAKDAFLNDFIKTFDSKENLKIQETRKIAQRAAIQRAEQLRNQVKVFNFFSRILTGRSLAPLAQPREDQTQFRAEGGSIFQPRGTDRVPVMATVGEFINDKKSTQRFFPQLVAMNAGNAPQPMGNTSNFGDINVTVQGSRTPEATGQNIGRALRREMRRGITRL